MRPDTWLKLALAALLAGGLVLTVIGAGWAAYALLAGLNSAGARERVTR